MISSDKEFRERFLGCIWSTYECWCWCWCNLSEGFDERVVQIGGLGRLV